MTDATRQEFEQRLRTLQRELATKAAAKVEPNRRFEEEVGGDEDEQPLNEMLQSVASGRNRNDARTAALVNKALAKLKDDPEEFGVCEDCGDDIPLPRLRALPWAELCVTCQSLADGPRGGPTRRKLTDFT